VKPKKYTPYSPQKYTPYSLKKYTPYSPKKYTPYSSKKYTPYSPKGIRKYDYKGYKPTKIMGYGGSRKKYRLIKSYKAYKVIKPKNYLYQKYPKGKNILKSKGMGKKGQFREPPYPIIFVGL
jgi:hypothetical protein